MENIDLVQAGKLLEEYSRNYDWFNKNYERLKKEYPNKIVAIENDTVIGSNTDPEELKKKIGNRPGAYIGSVIIEKLLWIL